MDTYLNETKEVRDLRNRFCALIASGTSPAMCKIKLWAELKNAIVREAFAKAGATPPPKALEPFGVPRASALTAAIRRLYRRWESNKIADDEFLARAHAINADFEVLAAHNQVLDTDDERYYDAYTTAIAMVTGV